MSEGEFFVLIGSMAVGPAAWGVWFFQLARIDRLGAASTSLRTFAALLLTCVVLLAVVLRTAASPDVRDAPAYLLLYTVLGLAWLRVGEFFNRYGGVSVRDDVMERGNVAAVPAIAGAWLGVTCCYAGGNIGAGPGWWVVVFSAALASAGLAVCWNVFHAFTHINDLVTIDRDPASGVRLGGLLAACGLILGRGVAGDWISSGVTIVDFVSVAWAVIPLVVLAMMAERVVAPTVGLPRPPVTTHGAVPALVYLVASTAYVVWLGWPL